MQEGDDAHEYKTARDVPGQEVGAGAGEEAARPHDETTDLSEASLAPSARSVASSRGDMSGRLSPRGARMSAAMARSHGHITDR
jgi:hypothetical protein